MSVTLNTLPSDLLVQIIHAFDDFHDLWALASTSCLL